MIPRDTRDIKSLVKEKIWILDLMDYATKDGSAVTYLINFVFLAERRRNRIALNYLVSRVRLIW